MISEISGLATVTEESLYKEETTDKLGRDQFLKLFLAQMNHQDPLNPMDSTEFSAQLAQFSSLEQLFNVNENLETIRTIQENGNRFQALDFIGKEIEAEGNQLYLEEGEPSSGGFLLDYEAYCEVLISNPVGVPVRRISLGLIEPGEHMFQWDGKNQKGDMVDEGSYSFEISAIDQSGQLIPIETMIKGRVTRVALDGNEPLIFLGDTPLTLSQVMDISLPTVNTVNE